MGSFMTDGSLTQRWRGGDHKCMVAQWLDGITRRFFGATGAGTACCVSVTVTPATVSVVARDVVAEWAWNDTFTEAVPDPDAGAMVAHAAPLEVVHGHPVGTVIATDRVPA